MNAKENAMLIRLQKAEEILYGMVTNRDARIKQLEQENEELKTQLKHTKKQGLFLK